MPYFKWIDWGEMALDDDAMVPIGARPALPWYGFPPPGGDDGHPSDLYDSLEPEIVGRNTEALHYSLTGEKLTATEDPVSQHNHNDEATLLEWIPLWRWTPGNGLAGGATGNGATVVNNTTKKIAGWGIFTLPSGDLIRPMLYPRMRATIPGQGGTMGVLHTEWKIYTAVSSSSKELGSEIVTAQELVLYADAAYGRTNVWCEGEPLQWLRSVAPVAHDSGKYVFYVSVSARVSAGDALLTELMLARRSWGS